MTMVQAQNCSIDFRKLHSALDDVNLLQCQGYVVRVSRREGYALTEGVLRLSTGCATAT